jgi:hypothetical protein
VKELVVPSRVFGIAARPRPLPAGVRPLLEFAARSESHAHQSIALIGSAIPLCR